MSFEQTVSDFKSSATALCTPAAKPDNSSARMDRLIGKLLSSADGIALAQFLLGNKIPIVFSDDGRTEFSASVTMGNGQLSVVPGAAHLVLNPAEEDDKLISLMFHEGQHARQYMARLALPGKVISPHHMAVYTRMLEADAQSTAVVSALKMKLAGDDSVWKASRCDGYEPMFDAAEALYQQDPSSLDDGRLQRAAFDAWFTPELKHTYDARSLMRKYPWFIEQLSNNPEHGFVRAPLDTGDLAKLGMLGQAKNNYMTLPDEKPLTDAYYLHGFSAHNDGLLQQITAVWDSSIKPAVAAAQKTQPQVLKM